ncbi:LysR family transcriptional regulator [Pseudoduganella chitinolytica]|uniref:LysR family transcriptional regulator n=1 Tax=Pseudoduganella chitinolytica TaxID=34070 RepID=A0ABY8BEA5_9BURK|nr:LysR family transcriptional regulator [Pseudoduganella chitinolytica]WEF34244.1 LysR family transcriptional regulator [Pseudoduganella chitinolytica]
MDLLALADFNLVARHGGFGRAARASGRPKATLSRRVLGLEASLGVRLLERGARTLKLTQEGQALHARMGPLLLEIDETVAAVTSGKSTASGRLRISAPLLFSQMAMGKLAASFALAYPDVRLEVTAEDRPVDMVEEGYDLVIRVNPARDETLVGRIFLRDRLAVVAHPAIGRPVADEPVPAVVRANADSLTTWNLKQGPGIAIESRLRLSSLLMVRDAVLAGVGAACLPVSLVSQDLAAGRLVHWGDLDVPEIALWALYPSRRLLSARVTAFLDHLKAAFPHGTPDELAAYLRDF